MSPGSGAYLDQVRYDVRLGELAKSAQAARSASWRVPGRVTWLTSDNPVSVRGVLSDGPHTVTFEGARLVWANVHQFDIVIVTGTLQRSESGNLHLAGTHVEVITPSAGYLDLRSVESSSPEDARTYPEFDLALNTERGRRLRWRPVLMQETRRFLQKRGFLEVDTPIIIPWPDIAPVEPVRVAAGAYVRPGDLRIANTEFMRRLLVGGFDKIFQLARCFRDERPTWKHDVEFTQLTFGIAFQTYQTLMQLIEELTLHLLDALDSAGEIDVGGRLLHARQSWEKVTVRDGILGATGLDVLACDTADKLRKACAHHDLQIPDVMGDSLLAQARIVDHLIETHVVPEFTQPTWLYEYPFYLGGPAKEILDRPAVKMRAELFFGEVEIANVSVPQNDPAKVRSWYEEIRRLKMDDGWKRPYLDEPYLKSMAMGIPVATTGGLGFDRLLMLLLGARDIRDVQLFPSGSQYETEV